MDRLIWWPVVVFFLLYGLFAVTNLKVEFGPTILGFSALVAGVVGLVYLLRGKGP